MKTQRVMTQKPRNVSLEDLLKRIPRPVFIRMVMKSGLGFAEQRALTDAHRNL